MIPRMIHQTWKTDSVPERFREHAASWQEKNPEWSYRLWSDHSLLEFVGTHYPDYLELFCSYRQGVQRADAGRYMLLHHFGGIYADVDAECVHPLDALATDDRVILCEEPTVHWEPTIPPRGLPFLLFNGVMASPAGHPFWLHLLDRMKDNRHAASVLDTTGPCLLTGSVLSYPNPQELRLEGSELFNPLASDGTPAVNHKGATSYAIHHWACT